MKIDFRERYLVDLYEGKTSKYKEFKSNPQLVKQYIKTVNTLKSIGRIEDLYLLKSLNYEKKKGDLKGKSAVWVNRQYRLIFEEVPSADDSLRIEVLELEELSKHYE
jgi:toxin HigB-1